MKSVFLAIILALFMTTVIQAQSGIMVRSIHSVKSKKFHNKSHIEIEIFTSDEKGFYVGALYWCLNIGTFRGIHEGSLDPLRIIDKQIRVFVISKQEWKALENGAPMHLTWGCNEELKNGQPLVWDYSQVKVFAYLDKKMLRKK